MRNLAPLLLALLAGSQLFAEESIDCEVPPTTVQLLKALPLISPANDDLQSFKVTVATNSTTSPNLIAQIRWSRGKQAVMCVSTGSENVPCFFTSQKRAFVFDALKGHVVLFKNVKPRFSLTATAENLQYNYGLGGVQTEDLLFVDLASFIKNANEPQVRRNSDGKWQLAAKSKSGNSVAVATFHSAKEPFELLHLRVHPADSDRNVLLEIRDIAINDPQIVFEPFPKTRDFPENVPVIKGPSEDEKSIAMRLLNDEHSLRRLATCQSAITKKEIRRLSSIPSSFDWARAEKNYCGVGCELRDLIRDKPKNEKHQTLVNAK